MALREEKRRFTVEEFLRWHEQQDADYELVDGRAVMMTGASPRHTDVVTNIVLSLAPQTRKNGCKTTPSDIGVQTIGSQVRYPDVLVRCGQEPDGEYLAHDPRLALEVLSPSTTYHDSTRKLLEYQSVASIEYILIFTPRSVAIDVHARDADGAWTMKQYTDLNAEIPLPKLGAHLLVADIYEGIELDPPELRLVD